MDHVCGVCDAQKRKSKKNTKEEQLEKVPEKLSEEQSEESREEIEKPLQWHPAFFAEMQIELNEESENLIFENEHQLGTKPKEIDILVIKKNSDICKPEISPGFIQTYKKQGNGASKGRGRDLVSEI